VHINTQQGIEYNELAVCQSGSQSVDIKMNILSELGMLAASIAMDE